MTKTVTLDDPFIDQLAQAHIDGYVTKEEMIDLLTHYQMGGPRKRAGLPECGLKECRLHSAWFDEGMTNQWLVNRSRARCTWHKEVRKKMENTPLDEPIYAYGYDPKAEEGREDDDH